MHEPVPRRTSKPTSKAHVQELVYDHVVAKRARAVSQKPASDQEHFIGWSDEDDTRDKEAAMSSPLKGSELQAEAKVCHHIISSDDCFRI